MLVQQARRPGASSSSRPTNDVEGAGRLPRRLRSTGTAAIAGSCARIASWSRRSSSPGSSPSSSCEHAPRLLERLERIGLAAAAVERQHQLAPQPLAEGLSASADRSAGGELPMLSERERRLELLLEGVDAQRLEPACLVAEPGRTGQTLQRRSAPEGQRRRDGVRRGRARRHRAARRASPRAAPRTARHRRLRPSARSRRWSRRSTALRARRAGGRRDDAARCAERPEAPLPTGRRRARRRRTTWPRPQREHRQQGLTLRAAHVRGRPARENLERAEKPDLQPLAACARVAFAGESLTLRAPCARERACRNVETRRTLRQRVSSVGRRLAVSGDVELLLQSSHALVDARLELGLALARARLGALRAQRRQRPPVPPRARP